MGKKNKEKKEKVVYIDDGSTLADMSGVSRDSGFGTRSSENSPEKKKNSKTRRENPYAFEAWNSTPWQTYIRSVRMMIGPMLVVIGILLMAFLIMYFLLG